MYEQVSHSLLNHILDELKTEIRKRDLRHFYTRLGANFYGIHLLFHHLYGKRDDFKEQMIHLVEVMAIRYVQRHVTLKQLDSEREKHHNWFLSQEWVGMALYADGFADNLEGVEERLPYLQELGVNMLHVMPVMVCPDGASDGGYAVSDFRNVDERFGSLEDINRLATSTRKRGMLLVMDMVLNHTSDEHEWAQRARAGEQKYQDYYYTFNNRDIPDMFEETMPEIFPETSPGNFTWDEPMNKWVMTVFNHYQWDLNYNNPAVFIEMLDNTLFWANQGADILRLDAVAFLWKKIGTTSQNEREAHLLLQLMKDCCQVTAPGVLFIAEAIVAPVEITKYFGEDAVIAKECEIAYNATFMALIWDAVATKNTKLLRQGIQSLPTKLDRATWLNYLRCHDDIGLGFDDADIQRAGYQPLAHRKFLVEFFTGQYDDSPARGAPFGVNLKTGDARISGSLASLVGLEAAIEQGDAEAIEQSVKVILLLHSLICSFGGMPLLYYGDEIGTLNDREFLNDKNKAGDNRWMQRPKIDWQRAERRHQHGTPEQQIFDGLKKMIAARKGIPAFADFNNRELIEVDNPHLFVFWRSDPFMPLGSVLVVCNFDSSPQFMELSALGNRGMFEYGNLKDLYSGESPRLFKQQLVVPPYQFYWLTDQRPETGLTL
ncbi:MAG: alpha-amylase family glycosyl hydrolase [Candidatus Thiodiazotropha lotti]|uniref:Alpha-amylase n=1 Tax=Candidatus Thiodiazotropha endoloripes TaxID=1818881 RepID=A0A1E2UHP0_9GAMM|nr:alpha-amylase family glycosyl hydrolase [Candidatus Thiodiazotropha endoloripes]MCG7900296.1 alpha-amylase family glycosyl hydrolase [Candidatus Thiodiazotropha weberae]MCG7993137.1 alpha-amylase family glycosyl hydrolase [Candidatus Thiodiazotropha lotti]MCG7903930.1 alpha-amylase family glycosyl hydrolase [Candidatus Thiodiazotropha weberae]MCG7915433.1 alpha-amylase family glycosyl hydrolase [Candidatus Thiodiazotropha weberae]MCG8000743.1 alpha-amylase family glycosyl hydrolase [Candida